MAAAASTRYTVEETRTDMVAARARAGSAGHPGLRAGRRLILASADEALRQRLAEILKGLRWEVHQATGGAELFACLESAGHGSTPDIDLAGINRSVPGTILLDSWLPDLEVGECVRDLALLYPGTDVFAIDGTDLGAATVQGPFRNEILHALRQAQQVDEAAWSHAPAADEIVRTSERMQKQKFGVSGGPAFFKAALLPSSKLVRSAETQRVIEASASEATLSPRAPGQEINPLPELLGDDPCMLEVSRRIRLVAPRSTAVLVQGPTGTGKELVARALHRLSPRVGRPFIALNCAAIPDALLEAELFGHTRGAFTGAVQGRVGRLEAAHGGTLFLDEIGELPLALQAKLLRFVECGELQRVGENEPVHVDVRIVAATHRKLGQMAAAGTFRADLYYRLSVFLIKTPALASRVADIELLVEHMLQRMAKENRAGKKELSEEAMLRLIGHPWPGNVRELEHTLERAWILSEDRTIIASQDIDFAEESDV